MSVIMKDREQVLELTKSLALFPEVTEAVIASDKRDGTFSIGFGLEETPENLKRYAFERIAFAMKRAYVANQLAYHYEYTQRKLGEIAVSFHLWTTDAELMPSEDAEKEFSEKSPEWKDGVLSELGSLRYNLYTNSGATFLGHRDQTLLDEFSNVLQKYRQESFDPSDFPSD